MNIFITIIFKALSFIKGKYIKYKGKYDKSRIMQTCASYGLPMSVKGSGSFVTENTYIGSNLNSNGIKVFGSGKVVIGDNFHCGTDCTIITDVHNYHSDIKIPYDDTYIVKDVTIEDNVWLGMQVMILSGVTIGEGAIIQAGSVVVSDIPKYAIAGGHPAKAFSQRNVEQYLKLKASQSYH